MRQLQLARRNEVKALAQIHRDRDELIRYFCCFIHFELHFEFIFYRMKREVASSLVERGVAERVRLAQSYEKRRDELQRQHDAVKAGLSDHRAKVSYARLFTFPARLTVFLSICRHAYY